MEEPQLSVGVDPARAKSRLARLAGIGVVLAAIACGAGLRIHAALTDELFDTRNPRGLLRSDPALLYYITERIVEGGGLPPADFRADPRVEYPELTDLPAMETVGQEFLAAWCYLLLRGSVPLHVVCVWLMGIIASLAVVGVYGIGWELTRSVRWATFGTALWLVLEGNYRTIGWILIREDLSVPLLSLHLYLAVRAIRTRARTDIALAALALVLAAGTWHAMGFVLAIEAVCVFAWFLRTGDNPLAVRGGWLVPLILAIGGMFVPVLWHRGFLLSFPMQTAIALLVAALLARRWDRSKAVPRLGALAALGIEFGAAAIISRLSLGGLSHYSHVIALIKAKILNLGVLPADPASLPFEARLLWNGPFVTADWSYLLGALGVALLIPPAALAWGAKGWITGRGEARIMVLAAFIVAAAVSGYMVSRTIILLSLLAPVGAVAALRMLRIVWLRRTLLGISLLLLGLQAYVFGIWIRHHRIVWYEPRCRNVQLIETLDWIEKHVPEGEPIAADFVTSTAILAHTRRPIVLQPKYETTRSRRRIEEFLMTFAHQTPGDFRELLRRYGCRYVVIDPATMWSKCQYVTGTPAARQGRPEAGTAAEAFCALKPRDQRAVSGFRYLFYSHGAGNPSIYRIFVLVNEPPPTNGNKPERD